MTGRGGFTSQPKSRLRVMVGIQLFWLLAATVLGAWWGYLVLRQSQRITELERKLGTAADIVEGEWHRMQRMLMWESVWFFGLVVLCGGFILWLHWREMQRTRAMQAFFASVTHELRTPLTSIRLQAESIADSGGKRELVDRLLEDTLRLESQVERTLELARVEGGGPLLTQTIELDSWLERESRVWREAFGSRLNLELRAVPCEIEGDLAAVQVVLKNLLENSFRHSKSQALKVKIDIQAGRVPGRVELVFSDNGAGYEGDTSQLGTLFKKGKGSQGAGVGLYLVRALMERMGGGVRFERGAIEGFVARLTFSGHRLEEQA